MKSNSYISYNIENFLEIQKILKSKYQHFLNNREKTTAIINWSEENFPVLFNQINENFLKYKSKVIISRFFYTPPNDELGIHVDGPELNDDYWALNIPISVSENDHWQEWFLYNDELITTSNNEYSKFVLPKFYDKLIAIDRLVLNSPHFVKVGIFHRIINKSTEPRLILTIRFVSENISSLLKQQ
jgi:hypothetical protein